MIFGKKEKQILVVEIPNLFTEKWLKIIDETRETVLKKEQVLEAFTQEIEAVKEQISADLNIPKNKILILEKGCTVHTLNVDADVFS